MGNSFWCYVRTWYGAPVGGPKYYAINHILRLFLYLFLHTSSFESIHNISNTQRTSPPWWWSRLPLQWCGFDDYMPPKGQAALHIYFPSLISKDLNRFIKLKYLSIYFYWPLFNSLSAKSVLAGEKNRSYILNFYVGIVHNILRETKTRHAKIYLPTQCTNWQILYEIN